MYGIQRELKESRWDVNLVRQRKRYRKAFYDSTHGSIHKSLAAAQAWRDEVKSAYLPTTRKEVALRRNAATKFGVTGVFCRLDASGQPYMWTAKTQLAKGHVLAKAFSVGKYVEFAYAMAVAERMKQVELISGYRVMHPAALPSIDNNSQVA